MSAAESSDGTEAFEGIVGVVGAGVIGVSVAHAITRAGIPVVLHDINAAALERAGPALARAERLARLRLGSADLAPVRQTGDLADLGDCLVVVENVVEDEEVKHRLHAELAAVVRPDAVVAVNTSAVPVTALALAGGRPAFVLGAHFMNPVALIDTVELVRTPYVTESALGLLRSLLARLGKTGVVVEDTAGFVINRCLMLFVNEAIALLDDGVATPRQIDQLFRGCLGHRSGPLQTADLIGLDTILRTLEVLAAHHGSRFEPTARLRAMVAAGELGAKTGNGLHAAGALR